MDTNELGAMVRAFASKPSRRAVVRGLTGLATRTPLAMLFGAPSAKARGRKGKGKKKNKPSPPPPPPPPPPPLLGCTPPCFAGQRCCPDRICCPVCDPRGGCCGQDRVCGNECCLPGQPCDPTASPPRCCDDSFVCGGKCCPLGQVCAEGMTPPQCCPTLRLCSDKCCAAGETCDHSKEECCSGEKACGTECCEDGETCVFTVDIFERRCCPNNRTCSDTSGTLTKCCPAGPEPVNQCCDTTDAQTGNTIVFCCYGNRVCGRDEDGNGSCCLPDQHPCGGSCCASDTFCCARTKNGRREYACCPDEPGVRCMKDRPDLRPCCSNC
jgi:hypothetical protein